MLRHHLARLVVVVAMAAEPAMAQDEASLRAADAAHHAAARANDGPALTGMAHANFRLYAPEGYIGDRERLIVRFQSSETGYIRYERSVESAVVTKNVGVVMGMETIQRPEQAPVLRRFTNIWIWDEGRWQWLARHAQVATKKEI